MLLDPKERARLTRRIARRVPESDVPDLFAQVRLDALRALTVPDTRKRCRKWLYGLVRNLIADLHDGWRAQDAALATLPRGAYGRIPEEAIWRKLWLEKRVQRGLLPAAELEALVRQELGEPLESIAARLFWTVNLLVVRLHRRREELRAAWALDNQEP
jgi:DNA-directed RNA polymerase specialized sigma24 family protein